MVPSTAVKRKASGRPPKLASTADDVETALASSELPVEMTAHARTSPSTDERTATTAASLMLLSRTVR